MLVTNYEDFELEINKESKDADTTQRYRVAVQRSPYGGTPHNYFDSPFSDLQLKTVYEQASLRTKSLPQSSFRELGQQLFDTVFTGDIRNNFERSLERAKSKKKGLRLCLRLDTVSEIADWPWEYLHDYGSFLADDPYVSIVRYLDLPNRPERLPIESTLNILVIIAAPSDNTERLDVKKEQERIKLALKELVQAKRVTIDWLEPATVENLREKLALRQYHILHFMGHGGFDPNKKEGYLLFVDANRQPRQVFSEDLVPLLYRYESLRLCVLNSCESGRSGIRAFDGVAQRLTRIGIHAVVAMQFQIYDDTAVIFTEGFYNTLAQEYHVDAAVYSARQLIKARKGSDQNEWGTPVLHMRVQDGNLFSKAKNSPNAVSRRTFITGIVGGSAAGIVGGFLTERWLPPIVWEMENIFLTPDPKNRKVYNPKELLLLDAPHRICEYVAHATGDRFRINILPQELKPTASAIVQSVSNGRVQCGYNGVYYDKEEYSPLLFNCAIPFGLNPHEQIAWLSYYGEEQAQDEYFPLTYMQKVYQELGLNIMAFPAGSTGSQMGGWFRSEINTLDDLSNPQIINAMRIPGLGGEVLQQMTNNNVRAVDNFPLSELKEALQRGEQIQAAEWIGPHDDRQLGLHEALNEKARIYYYYPGWWEPGTTFELQINQKAWDALPPEFQSVIKFVCQAVNIEILAQYDLLNSIAWQQIIADPHVELRRFSDDIIQAARNATVKVLNIKASTDNKIFKTVYTDWKQFHDRIRTWSLINDTAFYSFYPTLYNYQTDDARIYWDKHN